jgi:hypothetical protein
MKDEVNDFIAEPEHKDKSMQEVLTWNTIKKTYDFKL